MKQSDLAVVGRVGWYCASMPSKAHSCPLVASPDSVPPVGLRFLVLVERLGLSGLGSLLPLHSSSWCHYGSPFGL